MFRHVLICIVFCLSTSVQSATVTGQSTLKPDNRLVIHYTLEEGLRQRTTTGFIPTDSPITVKTNSQEMFLGGIELKMTASYEVHVDPSGNPIIDVNVLHPQRNEHFRNYLIIKQKKSQLSLHDSFFEHVNRAVITGLCFQIMIKQEGINVLVKDSCLTDLEKRWSTDPLCVLPATSYESPLNS